MNSGPITTQSDHVSYTNRHYRRPGIFWPLFLVAAGAVFLASNLGWITGTGWDFVLRLWPVLMIVGGLDSLYRGDGIAGPMFWTGLGIVFLLGNFGYLALSTWTLILNYWPVLLIAAGVDVLIGRRAAAWSQILAIVLALGLLGGIIFLSTNRVISTAAFNTTSIDETLQGATSAKAEISMSAGVLNLQNGAEGDKLVQGTVQKSNTNTLNQNYSVQNNQADFRVWENGVNVSFGGPTQEHVWDLKLNGQVPTDLKVNLGAGESNLNLTGLTLKSLDINTAVGKMVVTLPETGGYSGKINGAVGEVIIRVPRGLPVNIHATGGLTPIEAAPGFNRHDQQISSSGSGGQPVELILNQAIGAMRVEYLP